MIIRSFLEVQHYMFVRALVVEASSMHTNSILLVLSLDLKLVTKNKSAASGGGTIINYQHPPSTPPSHRHPPSAPFISPSSPPTKHYQDNVACAPPPQLLRSPRLAPAGSKDREVDIALLQLLTSPDKHRKFAEVCNENTYLFGKPATSVRKKTQNRRRRLQQFQVQSPWYFQKLLEGYQLVAAEVEPVPNKTNDVTALKFESAQQEAEPPHLPPQIYRRKPEHQPFHSQVVLPVPFKLEASHTRSQHLALSTQANNDNTMMMSPGGGGHRNALLAENFDQDITYDIRFDRPECTQGGIFPVLAKDVDVAGKELVDKLTLYLPFHDFRDYKAKRFRASLSPDFMSVTITMPTVPCYMYQNVAEIHKVEAQMKKPGCEDTTKSHKVSGVALAAKETSQTKRVTYRFPNGMTCNNQSFNGRSSGDRDLVPNVRTVSIPTRKAADGSDITQFFPYVFWEMAVDGETRRRLAGVGGDEHEDDLEAALSGLAFIQGGTQPAAPGSGLGPAAMELTQRRNISQEDPPALSPSQNHGDQRNNLMIDPSSVPLPPSPPQVSAITSWTPSWLALASGEADGKRKRAELGGDGGGGVAQERNLNSSELESIDDDKGAESILGFSKKACIDDQDEAF